MPATINDHSELHDSVAERDPGRRGRGGGRAVPAGVPRRRADGAGCRLRGGAADRSGRRASTAIAVGAGRRLRVGRSGAEVGAARSPAWPSVASVARGLPAARRGWSRCCVGTVGAMTAALIGRAFALTRRARRAARTAWRRSSPARPAASSSACRRSVVTWRSRDGAARARASRHGRRRPSSASCSAGPLAPIATRSRRSAAKRRPRASAADDLVGKMTRFGRRWRELELEAARSRPDDLKERLLLVGRRLEASNDPLARAELGAGARGAAAQLAYVEEIRQWPRARDGPARASSGRRSSGCGWAALRHRSADAARLGAELQPVVDELAQAGGDFDIAAEALTEATVAGALAGRRPKLMMAAWAAYAASCVNHLAMTPRAAARAARARPAPTKPTPTIVPGSPSSSRTRPTRRSRSSWRRSSCGTDYAAAEFSLGVTYKMRNQLQDAADAPRAARSSCSRRPPTLTPASA